MCDHRLHCRRFQGWWRKERLGSKKPEPGDKALEYFCQQMRSGATPAQALKSTLSVHGKGLK